MNDKRLKNVWYNMRSRCNNPNASEYQYYGARGIKICKEWETFEAFEKWAMSHGYNPEAPYGQCTIDRIDVNGNYEPSNCRFVSKLVQARNTRRRAFVEIDGVKKRPYEWAEEYSIPLSRFYYRMQRGDKGKQLIRPCKVYTSPGFKELMQILRGNRELIDEATDSGVGYYTILSIINGRVIPGQVVQKRLEKYYNKPKGYFHCEVEDVNED